MKPPASARTRWRASNASCLPNSRGFHIGRIGRSPSSIASANSETAPIVHATIGMSGIALRAIIANIGAEPTVRSASHASRRLTSVASMNHMSVRPAIADRMKGRRMPIITRTVSTISPE